MPTVTAKARKPVKKTPTLAEKIAQFLVSNGVSRKKAPVMAKGLTAVARRGIQQEQKKKDALKVPAVNKKDNADYKDGVGLKLRLDLPVLPMRGSKEAAPMRVMDGLTSTRTYIVAATKNEGEIIAIRQFGDNSYNVKFYPTMAAWEWDDSKLAALGAHDYLSRAGLYQRMHMPKESLDQLLSRVTAEAEASRPKSKVGKALSFIRAVSLRPLLEGFKALYGR